jgi:RNA polymerase sigma-70 factor (ECF subfamily)
VSVAAATIEQVFREESGQAIATLVRLFGDIDVAEEAVQEAFLIASERWPQAGVPPNPAGWIVTTAKNRAIDRFRREASRHDRHVQALDLTAQDPDQEDGAMQSNPMQDDRLGLIFMCCHPALAQSAQVALTLRLLGGLQTPEIARAFLVPEATMAQRLVRAKKKISAANIPYRIPRDEELTDRLRPVLAVVYLVYNEGHTVRGGEQLVRDDLCREAVRLARLLAELMPDEPEVKGLSALLLLSEARRPARTAGDGSIVLLPDQDRSLWDRELIAEGHALVRACLRRNQPGPYQLQAAINAVHTDAASAEETDWAQIIALYDQLLVWTPTPVVALNRAVAVAQVEGPQAGLDAMDGLQLEGYYAYHAARADLLTRLYRDDEARDAYEAAIRLTDNDAEQRHLGRKRVGLGSSD